jgi:lipopolysaccharide export system protein LptA
MKKLILSASILFASTAAVAAVPSAVAETKAAPVLSSSQPVTISAKKSLEWNRKNKTYTARDDVIATQGTTTLHSDTLTAHYTDEKGGGTTNITTLDADNHVTIYAPPYTATGDHAVYDVKTGNATLTGKDLKITSEDSVLTAQEKIEYNGSKNMMTAVGQPRAVKGNNTLTADAMSAWFAKDEDGKMAANKITTHGHVVIKTPTEWAEGDDGIYDVETQKAVLTGKVRILQDKNWIEGTRADVDMATGISRLSGSGNAATEGRVTGTFYPEPKNKDKSKDQKDQKN